MKRRLALFLCAALLISLLPAHSGISADGTDEAGEFLTLILPDGVEHLKYVQPDLVYLNLHEDVVLTIAYTSITGEGLVIDETRLRLKYTISIAKGIEHTVPMYSYQVSQEHQSDAIDIRMEITVTPEGGESYQVERTALLPVNHSFVCQENPDGATHSKLCICGKGGTALPHEWANQVSDEGLDGQFAHRINCVDCGASQLALCVFDAGPVVSPTCVEPGYTIYTCLACNRQEKRDETAPTEIHSYGRWFPNEENIEEQASHSSTCFTCHQLQSEACTFGEGVITDPSCETVGFTSHTCTLCSYSYTSNSTPLLTHQHGGWVAVAGSYPDNPRHTGVCARCGDIKEASCYFDDGTVTLPTCEHTGFITYVCQTCFHALVEPAGEQKPHTWGDWAPSTVTPGIHVASCTACGTGLEAPCVYGDGVITLPTCEQQGFITHTCRDCGYASVQPDADQLPHAWGNWAPVAGAPGFHARACANCQTTREDTCTFDAGIHTPPTCTRAGFITKTCSVCKHLHIAPGEEMRDHAFGPWAPLAGAPGFHIRTCPDCQVTERKSCAFDEGVKTPPTCLQPGFTTHTCQDCGATRDVPEGEAKGHSWGRWTTRLAPRAFHTRNCLACSAIDSAFCSYGPGVTTPPSCTEAGFITYTCPDCSHAYTVADAERLAHDWSPWEPSASNPGTHQRLCATCDETQETGCTYKTSILAPTCANQGFTLHTCSECKHTRREQLVPPTGQHSMSAWRDMEDGQHHRSCADCGHAEAQKHIVDWIPDPDGAHAGQCRSCAFKLLTEALQGELSLPDESIKAGERIKASWVFTGGLPPYTVTDLYAVVLNQGRQTRVDFDEAVENSVSFVPGTAGSGEVVVCIADSLGAKKELRKAFRVLPLQNADLQMILPPTMRCGDSIQAALAPVEAKDIPMRWSVDDTTLAEIDSSGWLTACAPGVVTVQAHAQDGSGRTAICQITVLKALLPGDANDDGYINSKDLISIMDFLIQSIPVTSEENADLAGEEGALDINTQDFLRLIDLLVGP